MSHSVKCPPPRQLGTAETLESLTHWKNTFRTYFKKDDSYKPLMRLNKIWDPSAVNYGQVDENEGLERSVSEVKEDLMDLLNTLAGFLPHSYLTDKLVSNTNNWNDVWQIIYEHYGVTITGETLLDFEDLHKENGETHRQFFERLLQHTRQHLAPANIKVEHISTGAQAEKMSVSLMNMVAVQWLRKTDPALIKIVRTEYSTELRDNIQLAALVPRIAPNIDQLLTRYNAGANCQKIDAEVDDMTMDELVINKVWNTGSRRGARSARQQTRFNQNNPSQQSRQRGPFCPACYYLGQQLQTTIHTKHVPLDCPRKSLAVNMLKMEDQEHFEEDGKNECLVSNNFKCGRNYQDMMKSCARTNSQNHTLFFFYKKPIALAEPHSFLKFQFLNLIFS